MQFLKDYNAYLNEDVTGMRVDISPLKVLNNILKYFKNKFNKYHIDIIADRFNNYLETVYNTYQNNEKEITSKNIESDVNIASEDEEKEDNKVDNTEKPLSTTIKKDTDVDVVTPSDIEKMTELDDKKSALYKMIQQQQDSINQLTIEYKKLDKKIENVRIKLGSASSPRMEDKYEKELKILIIESNRLRKIMKEEKIVLSDLKNDLLELEKTKISESVFSHSISNKDWTDKDRKNIMNMINPYIIKDFFIKIEIMLNKNDKKEELKLYWDKKLNDIYKKWYEIFDVEKLSYTVKLNKTKEDTITRNKKELSLYAYLGNNITNYKMPNYRGILYDKKAYYIITIDDSLFFGRILDKKELIFRVYGDLNFIENELIINNDYMIDDLKIKISDKILKFNNKKEYPEFKILSDTVNDVKFKNIILSSITKKISDKLTENIDKKYL